MKTTGVCPKCGGRDIAVMRRELPGKHDPVVDTGGAIVDLLPVERYLCCTCGYMESWVNVKEFTRMGGKAYWEEKERKFREKEEMQEYWNRKAAEQRGE